MGLDRPRWTPEPWRLARPPRLRALEEGLRHASYLELFFDLDFASVHPRAPAFP
jgi:hypothetical protein